MMKKKILSLLLALALVLAMVPAAALAAGEEGHIVLSFELYDPTDQTVALLRGPEKVAFGPEDTGRTLVEKTLGADSIDGTASFVSGLTIDGVTYGGDGDISGLSGWYWGLYLNNSPDAGYISAYQPADGDVYRLIFTLPDYASVHMYPTMPHDLDALYWAMAEAAEDTGLEDANALVQGATPAQSAIDAMAASLSRAGGSHYALVDDRTVQVDATAYPYTYTPTLTASPRAAAAGETVTVTVALPGGMTLAGDFPKANGVTLTPGDRAGEYTFAMPDCHVTLTAEFGAEDPLANALLTAVFSLDEAGSQTVPLTPAFDSTVTAYSLTVTDAQLPENSARLYSTVTLPEGAAAKMYYMMSFGGMDFATDGPTLTSGTAYGHSAANLFVYGNGMGHYVTVTPAGGGATRNYVFTMTRLLSLTGVTVRAGETVLPFAGGFDGGRLAHTVVVPDGTEQVTVAPQVFDGDNRVYVGDTEYVGEAIAVPVSAGSVTVTVADGALGEAEQETAYTLTFRSQTTGALAGLVMDNIAAKYAASGVAGDGNDSWLTADLAAYAALFPQSAHRLTAEQKQAVTDRAIAALTTATRPGDLAKEILALRALGYDARQVTTAYGQSLDAVKKLTDLVDAQAGTVTNIYTLPYVLLALQQGEGYATQAQLDFLVDAALRQQESWMDTTWGTDAISPMVLALAPYAGSREGVAAALADAAAALGDAQTGDGSLGSAASTGLACAAFAALGTDPAAVTHAASGKSLLDGLLVYVNESWDGFAPTANSFATEQGLRGLVAAAGAAAGEGAYRLFDFSAQPLSAARATQAEYCTVIFQTVPETAAVQVAQDGRTQTPNAAGGYDLAAGDYTYTASLAGYQTRTGSFTVTAEEAAGHAEKRLSVSLVAQQPDVGTETTREIRVTVCVKVHDAAQCAGGYTYRENAAAYTDLAGTPVTVTLPTGSSVFDALDATGLAYQEKSYGYLDVLAGLSELDHGPTSGWLYRVGTVTPQTSCRDYRLTEDATVTWFYSDDYTREYGSEQWTPPAVPDADLPDEETPAAPLPALTDVAGHWAGEAIEALRAQGLMRGVGETTFAPDSTLSRAMLAEILHRLAGAPAAEGENPFTDLADGGWYTDAVLWASTAGIVNGVGGGRFAPDSAVTREELVLMLCRYAAWQGRSVDAAASLAAFADADAVSDWALEAMEWANATGLIRGRSATRLAPGAEATRAEAAAVLKRFLEAFEEA